MNRIHNHRFNDMDYTVHGVAIPELPESDIRNSSHATTSHFQYPGPSGGYGHSTSMASQASQLHRLSHSHDHFCGCDEDLTGASDGAHVLSSPMKSQFSAVNSDHHTFSESDPTFSNLTDDSDFAAAFADFQQCDDCTPATKTTIPHHHHPSGRLAGASATLDGHFCCSWIVHGQPCFLCFESAEALDNHIKNDHAGRDGTYRCLWQNCSKHDNSVKTAGPMNFGNKPKLMRHVHSHTGYKPFPCPHPGCDKGFVTKEQLKNHETTHTKTRKYKCDQCGKAFAVKSALTTHITAVHDEKKTHMCEICGKAFADSSNLSKHKQTHYRESSVRKQRSKRGTSSATSTRSTPSIPTPSVEPSTPVVQIPILQDFSASPISPGLMAPPAPKLSIPGIFSSIPVTYASMSTTSTASSPPPGSLDMSDCYCCEDERCPAPEGPPTPCDKADDCDVEGFCDLPTCLAQGSYGTTISSAETSMSGYNCSEPLLHHHQIEQLQNFQAPSHWDDFMGAHGHDGQRSLSQLELEEQFTNMHGG